MNTVNLRGAVLDLASDDYIGLWEVVWLVQANSVSTSLDDLIPTSRKLVRGMIQDGSLQLYIGLDFAGEETRIDTPEALTLLDAETYWAPPLGSYKHLRLVATERGEEEYLGQR